MDNLIAFPQPVAAIDQRKVCHGAKTLFLHIKRTTLIVHLAAQPATTIDTGRIGKSS